MNEENCDIWQEVLDGVREIKSGGVNVSQLKPLG